MGFIIGLVLIAILGIVTFLITLTFYDVVNKSAFVRAGIISSLLTGFIAFIYYLMNAIMIVPVGEAKVLKAFGTIEQESYGEGTHLVDPFASSVSYRVRKNEYDYEPYQKGDDSTLAVSKDGVSIDIQATFGSALNVSNTWKIEKHYGKQTYNDLMEKAAWSSVRDVLAKYEWRDATMYKKNQFSVDLTERFKEIVVSDLMANGFTENEAEKTFSFAPVKLRRMLPPEKIRVQINEREREREELKTEETLLQKAEKRAERRKLEGQGITNMLDALPENVEIDADTMIRLIRANADWLNAETLKKLAENDNVKTLVMPSDTPASVKTD